jgi:hypothetical protein
MTTDGAGIASFEVEGMSNLPLSDSSTPNLESNDANSPPRGEPISGQPPSEHATTIHVVDSKVAPLPSAPPRPPKKDIIEYIASSLPAGIELHRAYRFQPPSVKQNKFELAVLKLHAPEHLESKLTAWRRSIEDQFPELTILVRRVEVDQNLQSNLRNRFRTSPLLTHSSLPELDVMLSHLCGYPPAPRTQPRSRRPRRINLHRKQMIAIDSSSTLDREDLIFGERLQHGLLKLSVAFIDVTDYVPLGSDADKYALRVGSPIWGRTQVISPLGPSLRCGPGSFREGEARAAWVVESVVSPAEPLPLLNSSLVRAWVVNHKNLDPERPTEVCPHSPLGKNLAALAEITQILENRRSSKSPIIRIDGEGLLSRIVAQSMIHAKSFLGRFASTQSQIPAIFRVHQYPSDETIADYIDRLHAMGIPASAEDFGPEFFSGGILRALEEKNHPAAHILSNTLLDAFMLRSQYSTRNVGHYGLGLDAYMEIKPRDATGLANQLQLDALYSGRQLISEHEMSRRADSLNLKRWDRDIRQYKIRFLEDLADRLAHVGELFLGVVEHRGKDTFYCDVDGFYRWGIIEETTKQHLRKGDLLALQLKGFNIEQMRYEFSICKS